MSNVLVAREAFGKAVRNESVAEPKSGLIYSTILGTSLGFIAGAINGGILLAYVPATAANWTQAAVVLMVCALGWAGYGAIIGGSGILARGE